MISGFGHMNIAVRNLEASMDFYINKMGMELAFQIHDEEGKLMVTYLIMPDGNFLELIGGGPRLKNDSAMKAIAAGHLCFEVLDINEAIAKINELGLEIVGGPRTGRDKNSQVFITDPDGNRIELMQMDPKSPQRQAQAKIKRQSGL